MDLKICALGAVLKDCFDNQSFLNVPSCAILGPNPMSFPWGYDEEDEDCLRLKHALKQELVNLSVVGIENFWIACDPGVGLWCGEFINRFGDDLMLDINLCCKVPYEEHANKWHPELRNRYFEMLAKSECEDNDAGQKTPFARLNAYRAIIDKADILLIVHDGDFKGNNTLNSAIMYAQSLEKPMIIIDPVTHEGTLIG